ncbi:NDP-hexose 2,3-dehydratase family protein [Streptoalloteichus hindustanus]|uniref:Oxidase EvaA n=1 Tax=Streptoalloteichus hindustanus TaxID=2017 RepID=A0A1M5HZB5_STRHI|nr:NDP-hexose 2,3-dehydratase family protein [Streptoalloteichus hindustanus]SHG21305.1 oxidase EvaA [Streptoalloteichus hindustanus]
MTGDPPPPGPARRVHDARRIAHSALARHGSHTTLTQFHHWFRAHHRHRHARVRPIPLTALQGWRVDPDTGDIHHHTGRFFSLHGLEVRLPGRPVAHWSQPIINQPEVGILGILAREFDGVLHFLMQAKVEPGNCNGLQLSPTVQATRSNYTRVHGGAQVPYLDHFRDPAAHHRIADVRQSEQGAWFYQKRNRNMVVEATGDVEVRDGFQWLTLGQIHQLLAEDDLVNMDVRTVLSCLPLAAPSEVPATDDFHAALLRSADPAAPSRHDLDDLLHWITEARSATELQLTRVPLNRLADWRHHDGRIIHHSGHFFEVTAVAVRAGGREVAQWTQPMIRPTGLGVIGLLVARIHGVLHALLHAHTEPGYADVVELAPTVQCTPANYQYLPAAARPAYLDQFLRPDPQRIRFDTTLSEEGGRFYHARNRYLIVETDPAHAPETPEHRWLTLHQLGELLRHSYYLNVQARSLVSCLHSLFGATT